MLSCLKNETENANILYLLWFFVIYIEENVSLSQELAHSFAKVVIPKLRTWPSQLTEAAIRALTDIASISHHTEDVGFPLIIYNRYIIL